MDCDSVLVLEDSALTAALINDYLNNNGFKVCGTATSFQEAITLFETHKPSILICDINIKGSKNGIDFVKHIKHFYPTTLIIFISSAMEHSVLMKAQNTKPHAYLTKPFTEAQLVTTIQMAAIRRHQEDPSAYDLTDKDIQVLELLGQGKSNKEIGEQLFISHHTVDSRRRKILLKLNVSSINQALCIASDKGWFTVNSEVIS